MKIIFKVILQIKIKIIKKLQLVQLDCIWEYMKIFNDVLKNSDRRKHYQKEVLQVFIICQYNNNNKSLPATQIV